MMKSRLFGGVTACVMLCAPAGGQEPEGSHWFAQDFAALSAGIVPGQPGASFQAHRAFLAAAMPDRLEHRGVLDQLDALAGPDGWPVGAYDARIVGVIGDWKQLTVTSALFEESVMRQGLDLTALAAPARDENGRLSLSMTLLEPVADLRGGDLELFTHGAHGFRPLAKAAGADVGFFGSF